MVTGRVKSRRLDGEQWHLMGAAVAQYMIHLGGGFWGASGSGGADLSGFLPLSVLTACLPHCGPISCLLPAAGWLLLACLLPPPAGCMEALRWGLQPLLSRGGRGRESCEKSGPSRQGDTRETVGGVSKASSEDSRGQSPRTWAPGAGRRVLGWLGALGPSKLLASDFVGEMTGSEVSLFLPFFRT